MSSSKMIPCRRSLWLYKAKLSIRIVWTTNRDKSSCISTPILHWTMEAKTSLKDRILFSFRCLANKFTPSKDSLNIIRWTKISSYSPKWCSNLNRTMTILSIRANSRSRKWIRNSDKIKDLFQAHLSISYKKSSRIPPTKFASMKI